MSVFPIDAAQNPPARKKWFHLHVLLVAVVAFTGRALPLSFLPITLGKDFGQSGSTIGAVMAVYPLAALLTTPWAAAIARRTQRIVTLHSISIIMIAFALALSAAAPCFQSNFGDVAGTVWLAVCRVLQGLGASFYLSSNTCLLARKCPDDFTYLIGMTEVASGAGGQIGRMLGGFLFDFGGLPCPFLVCALLQIGVGFIGFGFEDAASDLPEKQGYAMTRGESTAQTTPWSELLKPRVCLGALCAFMMYFNDGVINANILQWMSVHLAPITVGVMNICTSFRSLCYLTSSFVLAQLMRRETFSFECLLICGSILAFVGASLLAPQPFVTHAQAMITGTEPSYGCLFVTQLLSFVIMSGGNACLFLPSLPLMQSEVHELGQTAVEQVAELFVMMMNLGEMVGPVFGGVLVENGGFVFASLILALLCIPVFLLGVTMYDSTAIKSRQTTAMLIDEDFTRQVTDGEANVSLRMLPFVFAVNRHDLWSRQFSAPPTVFRRKYGAGMRRNKYGSSPPLLDVEARVPHAESTEPARPRKPYVPPFTSENSELDTESTLERQVATDCKKVLIEHVDTYDELEIDREIAMRQNTC